MKKTILFVTLALMSLLVLSACSQMTDRQCQDKLKSCNVVFDSGECRFTGALIDEHQKPMKYPDCNFYCEESYVKLKDSTGQWYCQYIQK